jgi:hypothetical protein
MGSLFKAVVAHGGSLRNQAHGALIVCDIGRTALRAIFELSGLSTLAAGSVRNFRRRPVLATLFWPPGFACWFATWLSPGLSV